MKPQPNHEHWLPLTGPGVLLCAQLLALVALLTFRARAGGLPVTGPGIALYCASVLLSVAGFLLLAARRTRTPSTWAVALLILPALSSFVFWWGLGVEFPPWGHHDTEVVLPFFLFLAGVLAAAVGGLLLAVVIGMLPQNGEWLGYIRLEPAVPQNA